MIKNQQIAIIAASHSLGQRLIAKLPKDNVRAIGRSLETLQKKLPAGVELCEADFNNPEQLKKVLENCELVVNIAHARFVPVLLEHLPPSVKKVVAVGSTWKYTRFANERAEQVRKAEQALINSGLEWVMLHPSMIYGLNEEKTVSRLLTWLKKIPVVPLPGGGKTLVQPVHADDIVEALTTAVLNPAMNQQAFVLAAHQPVTYYEMVKICGELLGKKVWVLPVPTWLLKMMAKVLKFTPLKGKLREDQIDRLTEDKNFDVRPIEMMLGRNLLTFKEGLQRSLDSEIT